MHLRAGVYYPFIKDLVDLYPRNQIHIVKADEYFKDRLGVMEQVFSFLDVGKLPLQCTVNRCIEWSFIVLLFYLLRIKHFFRSNDFKYG